MSSSDITKQKFGVALRPSAVALYEEIKNLYGKDVVVITGKDAQIALDRAGIATAKASVDDQGNPEITLYPGKTIKEATIVHELLHLKQYWNGAPSVARWGRPSDKSLDQNMELRFALTVDAISHYLMYPQMRKMGFDPTVTEKSRVNELMRTKNFQAEYADFAVELFSPALVIGNSSLILKFKEWFRRNRLVLPLDRGNKMVHHIVNHPPQSDKEIIKSAIEVMNILYDKKVRFQSEDYNTVKRGNLIQQNLTIIVRPIGN